MIQSYNTDYEDAKTASQITDWARAKYGAGAPSFATQPGQPTPQNAPVSTSWASSMTGAPMAPASRAAPTLQAPPSRQLGAPAPVTPTATTQIDPSQVASRTVDAASETVQGRMTGLLGENSQYMQQARSDAMRSANERGMLNTAMAASGGTDAAIRSALPIATTDAGTYAGAADYNVAAKNQTTMWNADQKNQGARADAQLASEAAARAQARELAVMQDDTTRWSESNRTANSQWETQLQNETAKWERQVADATTRYTAELQNATSRYNTDEQYRRQVDENRASMANNIIQNMDMSPDRKAAMLEALGQGKSAGVMPDGSYRPGSGLAGAVYVIDAVAQDLNFGSPGGAPAQPGAPMPAFMPGGAGAAMGGAIDGARAGWYDANQYAR